MSPEPGIRVPAAEALRQRGFRIAAVHYWQGQWNYNFWSNLDPARLDDDFRRIRSLGFNTIALAATWGVFQRAAFPPRYDDAAFARLDEVLAKASAHGLYAVLRTGTSEWLPEGIEGGNYHVPFLLFDAAQLGAFTDLYRELARRLARRDNVLFLFSSWEDMFGYAGLAHQPLEERRRLVGRAAPFFAHLRSRPIAHWNKAWGTGYRDHEDVPYPEIGTPAYGDLLRWVDERLTQIILPRIERAARVGDGAVRLGFEVRIDMDPVQDPGGRSRWFSHESTWSLPGGFDVVGAYFNPSWGARNEGDTIHPRRCLGNLRRLVRSLRRRAGARHVFVDQFNFVDTTPAFRHNSRLQGEPEIARFLGDGLDWLLRKTLGYAIWSLDAYEANLLINSQFREGLRGWRAQGRAEADGGAGGIVLQGGASIAQTVFAPWNPGGASPEVPYTLRLRAAGAPLRVRFVAANGSAPPVEQTVELGMEPVVRQWEWPMRSDFDLELRAEGGAVRLEEVTVFNHVQEAALFDPRGAPLGRRAEVVAAVNQRWIHSAG